MIKNLDSPEAVTSPQLNWDLKSRPQRTLSALCLIHHDEGIVFPCGASWVPDVLQLCRCLFCYNAQSQCVRM